MPIPVMKGYASLKTLPEEKVGDKISRKILVGEKEMVVFWKMKAGARAAMHQHPHEQIFWMLSGTMEFNLAGEKRTCDDVFAAMQRLVDAKDPSYRN